MKLTYNLDQASLYIRPVKNRNALQSILHISK